MLHGDVTVGVASSAGVAPLADAEVASPADLAGVVTMGVASLADAGVASLANAGVVPLADAGVAPLADAGVASLADTGVAPLADAGVASLADAGVKSLADLTGSVAGGVTDWTVPVLTRTEEMTFLRETVVRNRSVFNGLACCISEMGAHKCIVVILHRPALGVGRCQRFVMIQIVIILTTWVATRTV